MPGAAAVPGAAIPGGGPRISQWRAIKNKVVSTMYPSQEALLRTRHSLAVAQTGLVLCLISAM
jgi:hypothetical protein